MTTRAEHLAWAKERALEYVEAGEPEQAFASLASDLNKHPETANHPGVNLGMMLLLAGAMEDVRKFIEGFN